jgi:Phage portal protein, SPP1 Gp6-like
MAYRLQAFSDVGLSQASLTAALDQHQAGVLPRLDKFWSYFRNPLRTAAISGADSHNRPGRWYRQAQEAGLPARVLGERVPGLAFDDRAAGRREVVIENDIGWRISTMIDFMFGKPVKIRSTCADEAKRTLIERALETLWETSGGISLLQDMALLGHVFGHVDLLVRVDDDFLVDDAPAKDGASLERMLRGVNDGFVRVELVEPRRGVAILDSADYRRILAYVVSYEQAGAADANGRHEAAPSSGLFERLLAKRFGKAAPGRVRVTHVISGSAWQLYHDEELVAERSLSRLGGKLPVVHVQNVAQPFAYEGMSDVEPLIPLQDELNTRLSDRACRVTMQSFKMYLAKGIEGFDQSPVGPGQVWSTDNPQAEIAAFGGDAHSPSEEAHILEIREALDKVSGVPPLASGVIRAKVGNLTSATALRITMMGLIARTARKRVTYGRGIAEASRLMLAALDSAGILRTDEADRGVRLEWPDPIPLDERDLIANVIAKDKLGVERGELLGELGHAASDPGIG